MKLFHETPEILGGQKRSKQFSIKYSSDVIEVLDTASNNGYFLSSTTPSPPIKAGFLLGIDYVLNLSVLLGWKLIITQFLEIYDWRCLVFTGIAFVLSVHFKVLWIKW